MMKLIVSFSIGWFALVNLRTYLFVYLFNYFKKLLKIHVNVSLSSVLRTTLIFFLNL